MDFKNLKGSDTEGYQNLMIVDGLNLAFRYKYANKKNFAAEYVNTIRSFRKSYDAKDTIILGDGGSTYRETIYPEYKANRKELRANQTEEEAQDFKDFLDEFSRAFELLEEEFYTFRFRGVEADDIAAFITTRYAKNYEHTWLISSDKDWDLLVRDNVSRFSYKTRKEIRLDNWAEHYPYKQEDHISIKVLMGDKGDHIPGVDGVAEKRALGLINEYGTAYDIYASLPINSKYKYIQNLNNFGDNILLNYELMDLETYCDKALGDNTKVVVETFEDLK